MDTDKCFQGKNLIKKKRQELLDYIQSKKAYFAFVQIDKKRNYGSVSYDLHSLEMTDEALRAVQRLFHNYLTKKGLSGTSTSGGSITHVPIEWIDELQSKLIAIITNSDSYCLSRFISLQDCGWIYCDSAPQIVSEE